jgi:hypothetical protein
MHEKSLLFTVADPEIPLHALKSKKTPCGAAGLFAYGECFHASSGTLAPEKPVVETIRRGGESVHQGGIELPAALFVHKDGAYRCKRRARAVR